jgi:uncharacterized protein
MDRANPEWRSMPYGILQYNGQSEPCDALVGPCSCGAWHDESDWPADMLEFIRCNDADQDRINEPAPPWAIPAAGPARGGDWIQTFSGAKFYPLNPREYEICVEDIAHALANQCRYAGHVREFLSVAEHSVRVSRACDPADALWGLLHDASEFVLGDICRPLKHLPQFAFYREAEDRLQRMICRRFGLPEEMPESVQLADETLLATEARDLMAPLHPEWARWIEAITPLPERIVPWPPVLAEAMFLGRFHELTRKEGREHDNGY